MTWETIANWPARTRGEAFLHESFHIVQMSKGIATPDRGRLGPNIRSENEHLDAVDGRYWLRLEWRGYQSSVEMSRQIVGDYLAPLLNEYGFTVFAVRHGSSPRYPLPAIVSDVRRAVRFIRQHAGDYGVESDRIGVWAPAPGGSSRCCFGTTADSGDPSASDATLREPSRVAAVVAFYAAVVRWFERHLGSAAR